jgi:hypothetical protein
MLTASRFIAGVGEHARLCGVAVQVEQELQAVGVLQ